MGKSRLEAFSDGVIAIIITIMVLELKAPESASFAALPPLAPVLLSYVLSFIYVGIYWNNHHHMLSISRHVSGKVLWANLHCCSGCRCFPSPRHGWGKTTLPRRPRRRTAWCCSWQPWPTGSCSGC
jgi:hypothetical protein